MGSRWKGFAIKVTNRIMGTVEATPPDVNGEKHMINDLRVFTVIVQHMPFKIKYTLPIMARTRDEAIAKAHEWTHYRKPGAFEYFRIETPFNNID